MEIERANPQQLKLNGKSLTLKNSSEGNQPVPTNTTNAGVQSKDLPSLYEDSFHPSVYIDQLFTCIVTEPEIQWMLDQAIRIFGGDGGCCPLGMGEEQGVTRTMVEMVDAVLLAWGRSRV